MTIAFYDTECFPNYWLLKFKPQGGQVQRFALITGQSFTQDEINAISLLFNKHTVVSFNGIYYDVPMITAALAGYNPGQLKWLNDRIILQQAKPWELGLPEWKPADHIDIMSVAPGAGSQKQYAGRLHYPTMQDLPYDPSRVLTDAEMAEVDDYCDNDLGTLEALFNALAPQLRLREGLTKKYGIDVRSKSDAQIAEAALKIRCDRNYKLQIDWNLRFKYKVPEFIAFSMLQPQGALQLVREAEFTITRPDGGVKCIAMPSQLEGLKVVVGSSTYKMGLGGLHSQEKCMAVVSDEDYQIRIADVASYYPNLMINSGEFPPALGVAFLHEFKAIKDARLTAKALAKRLKEQGLPYEDAATEDAGGKIQINGTFGKCGSPYSVLWAPELLVQTTITGQLSLLMLIESLELEGIRVVSANTDGIVIKCPRSKLAQCDAIISHWEVVTGLQMETDDYLAIHARDVNNYFAIKTPDDVKRKGAYSAAGLMKNPDVELCADAVADFLSKGVPMLYTIAACRDLRKFVSVKKVTGGGVKMWGEGVRKGMLVRDMPATLTANGWFKDGRSWRKGDTLTDATTAYVSCFEPQRREYLGKVIRWYYGTNAPGPIVYASNDNTVGMSYGAKPCMNLPDEFPDDIDYLWYLDKAESILKDVGVLI